MTGPMRTIAARTWTLSRKTFTIVEPEHRGWTVRAAAGRGRRADLAVTPPYGLLAVLREGRPTPPAL